VNWSKRPIERIEGDTALLSVVFTWDLPQAYSRAVWLREMGYHVRAGGPAVKLMPGYLADVAECNGMAVNALPWHNPDATFTSRGCIRRCPFCAVPRIEGELVELNDWSVRPIVCDNNLLACSKTHFDDVVDKLKPLSGIDFNQGLDARLLTKHHAERLAELDCIARLAWDDVTYESPFRRAYEVLRHAGFPAKRIFVYVLVGYNDTPEDALYRLSEIWKMGSFPNPMRYQPLDALHKNSFVGEHWTERKLCRYMRYWARLFWFDVRFKIPFEKYEG